MRIISLAIAFVMALAAIASTVDRAAAVDGVTIYSVEEEFENVVLDVTDAIVNRGYKIDYTARIGEMLDRTAADVGASRKIYKGARILQFCSAVVSRQAMEADAQNIAFCPYSIFLYELADKPGTVEVGYRRLTGGASPESQAVLDKINALLDGVAREAAGVQ